MDKLNLIRKQLEHYGSDALFVSGQENVTYLTAKAGLNSDEREVFLVITKKSAYLLAFSTTFAMYRRTAGFIPVELTNQYRLSKAIIDIAGKEKLKTLAFEKNYVSYSEYISLKEKLSLKLTPSENIIEKMRLIKSNAEIESIKKAASVTDSAYEYAARLIKPGITEKNLALNLEFFIRKNSQNIAFSPIVAFNQNSAIPHYLPSDKVTLKNHSIILIDMGAKFLNYCSDLTRVICFGSPSDRLVKLYQTVLTAQENALSQLTSGKTGDEIDRLTREYIEQQGYPAFKHGLGHGVGLAIHEAPRLKPGSHEILCENMVVTVEPGIYIEGFAGIRIEDLVLITSRGPKLLSRAPKEITVI
ncbi:hypothetical protein A3D05_04180 [Candidatus Gottesmanbacteria bacterium RIFCSPHIGHO2_02_FULL_40_24]|uniref:Peptidase M24 domain-containing protein n=1 Tax=Candidatus Gottesmanbacteria bacterium RIFCSPHIGHO2_01_FULL_40_15 TaxID=1798376 RepID=A0A1F5Z1A4_9BACT|nr:MAG: hypothetical protein A2777_00970 [Candidatus Gottesmanbacteria bacterium RIFCSPHIGHO2_01_FULL_40_15]OGG17532.1 MAG: hypothetical protein A3D05_04180 [Candidatus Gottesmanbacteria bacterium RIFCSPHIGHO2_02_FULL_40_24]OGG21529.1 MAG: hypothetical protein A3B48_01725 [Candidatus Gottesmanbacteria bacterium RIFCSPLOWO2_01_FULL_40_10]OGG25188.1 MAG: hypothetical protein A3E42_01095 [Candidatus Gottesmanbacteria bacterium RIFCSPHIGHO2_12_FULL_40_13]OGG32780.1 MAG: hypothetical protein A3I80_0